MVPNRPPNDEPFNDELCQAEGLDAPLDARARGGDQSESTPMSRASRRLSQFHAPQAAQEAEAIERVRQRLLGPVAALPAAAAPPASSEDEVVRSRVPLPARARLVHRVRPPGRPSRLRAFMGGVAAVVAVGALAGGFAVLLHASAGGPGGSPLTTSHWQVIPSPNTALAVNALTGITVRSRTDGWAWGTTNVAPTNTHANPITIPLVEHWDGQHWHLVATPPPPEGGQIANIAALAPEDAWAVGQQLTGGSENTSNAPLVEHWDGQQWTVVQDTVSDWPAASGLAQLAALSADNIWAVGSAGNGVHSGLIQHWDGHHWQTVAHPAVQDGVQFSGITALAPDDIWVAGSGNNGSNGAVFEHWDGRQWRLVPSPAPSGLGPIAPTSVLSAISAVSPDDIWAAGRVNPVIPFPNGEEPLFEHWDGHRWNIVDGPSVEAMVSDLVALGPDDVWAVGTTAGGLDVAQQGQGLVEHWDGQSWSLIANPSPRPFTSLGGVAGDPSASGKVWVAGTTGPALSGPDQLTDVKTLIETNQ